MSRNWLNLMCLRAAVTLEVPPDTLFGPISFQLSTTDSVSTFKLTVVAA